MGAELNQVVLSLGSNLGDRISNIENAYQLLEKSVGNITLKSSFYSSEPHGFVSDNTFLNSVVFLKTVLSPTDLLTELVAIEHIVGRKKKTSQLAYCDREIDIDILFYDNLCLETKNLILPHPRLYHRNFVLVPLLEISPDYVDPKSGKTVRKLFELSEDKSHVFRF